MTVVSVAARKMEDRILEQYLEGYSQKDIAARLKVTPKDIRLLLKKNGLETSRFRALDEITTHVVLLLVTNGVKFRVIEEVCNIAVHATREIVFRNNLQRASKRARLKNPEISVPEGFKKNPRLLKRYLAGESFCSLCKDLRLRDDQILNEFHSFTKSQVRRHNAMLKRRVLEDAALHFSPTSIARRRKISMSVVRKILQRQIV